MDTKNEYLKKGSKRLMTKKNKKVSVYCILDIFEMSIFENTMDFFVKICKNRTT